MTDDPRRDEQRRDDPPRDRTTGDETDGAEEALNWDTSIRDASYVEGPKPVREKAVRRTRSAAEPVESAGSASEADSATEAGAVTQAPTSSILLVTYGIVAGIFLLYTIGWFTTVRSNTYVDPSAFGALMTGLGGLLAIAAAPVWFAAVFVLTRESKPITRLLWLLLGLVLLVPIPFVLGV
ncbi:hypothetical protein [Conyzicola sp.]|uniref:hypothetical protein n=1 Tax=Conyzicola sp. TaxID=1969404 RepID=UPI003989B471